MVMAVAMLVSVIMRVPMHVQMLMSVLMTMLMPVFVFMGMVVSVAMCMIGLMSSPVVVVMRVVMLMLGFMFGPVVVSVPAIMVVLMNMAMRLGRIVSTFGPVVFRGMVMPAAGPRPGRMAVLPVVVGRDGGVVRRSGFSRHGFPRKKSRCGIGRFGELGRGGGRVATGRAKPPEPLDGKVPLPRGARLAGLLACLGDGPAFPPPVGGDSGQGGRRASRCRARLTAAGPLRRRTGFPVRLRVENQPCDVTTGAGRAVSMAVGGRGGRAGAGLSECWNFQNTEFPNFLLFNSPTMERTMHIATIRLHMEGEVWTLRRIGTHDVLKSPL